MKMKTMLGMESNPLMKNMRKTTMKYWRRVISTSQTVRNFWMKMELKLNEILLQMD